jgi:hypothetical protein
MDVNRRSRSPSPPPERSPPEAGDEGREGGATGAATDELLYPPVGQRAISEFKDKEAQLVKSVAAYFEQCRQLIGKYDSIKLSLAIALRIIQQRNVKEDLDCV